MPQNSSMFIPSSDILQVLHRVYIPIDSPQFWPKIPDAGHTSSHDCRCLGWTWFPPLMQPSASHVGQPPGRWGSSPMLLPEVTWSIQESQVVYPRSIWRSLVWGMGSSWIFHVWIGILKWEDMADPKSAGQQGGWGMQWWDLRNVFKGETWGNHESHVFFGIFYIWSGHPR